MDRLKFSLTSDQLELLLAFETVEGLNPLAELMAKDPSVVSRNLQRMAEDQPVLTKIKNRWELTPLGLQINQQTRAFLEGQKKLISSAAKIKSRPSPLVSENSVLIIINAQNGLMDATETGRNNSEAEANIIRLLGHWRTANRQVIHVKHLSERTESPFFKNSPGSEFLPALQPQDNEVIIEKTKSSAFAGTPLETILNKAESSSLLLVGFTANECIDATARDSSALGFETCVAGDATATYDLRAPSGKLVKAERIHKLTLLNINAFYAKVVNTNDILHLGNSRLK